MELQLKNGDYIPDEKGGVVRLDGDAALLQRVLFRLSARRGGLSMLPELGSQLYLLGRERPEARLSAARQYAAEAVRPEGLTVEDYFDDIYLSYRLKACKPNAEIFEKVIASSHIVPQETLFFDDSQKNLDTAAALGFKTHLVTPDCGIIDFFNSRP